MRQIRLFSTCRRCGDYIYPDNRRKCRSCGREYNVGWRKKNRQHIQAYDRAYQTAHPNRRGKPKLGRTQYQREYRLLHIEQARILWKISLAIRRARILNAAGNCSQVALEARIAYYGFRCWVCRGLYDQIDHVKPLSAGGSNWPANLRPICRRCNTKKGKRWPFLGLAS